MKKTRLQMRTILRIMKTELKVLFCSPIAWMLLIVFTFQVGIQFTDSLGDVLRTQSLGYRPHNITQDIVAGYRGVITEMLRHLYLYIPLLTMGLMSRELGSGSIKLLYSSPVSNFQIIIGKYLSIIVYSFLLIGIILIPTVYTIFVIKDPDIPVMLTSLLGMFLTVAAYAAIGLFMSTITKYQVVAAVGTLALLTVLNFVGNVGQSIDFVRDITFWLSIRGRSEVFTEGMVCTRDIFYFILIIFLFLTLSITKLRGERLKLSVWSSAAKYVGIFSLVAVLGYISSRPQFIVYHDVTATKSNTLTENSQEVLKRIKGEISITSYSNILDDTWYRCTPSSRNYDIMKFEKYLRFRPDIKFNYVFYWGEGNNKYLKSQYPDLTTEELFHKVCEMNDHNPKRFKSEKEITDDLSQDYGRFVRVVRANGRVAYLRKYDDIYVDPRESEITAAFKTLVDKSPLIAFVTGHGERGSKDHGERGYGPFATNITFRHALVNQGFSVRDITLDTPVEDDVDVIVISDMKSPLTEEEFANYEKYIDDGGSLFLLGEPRRQENMNPLAAKLGLKFSDGIIVSPSKEYTDEILVSRVMPTALEASEYFSKMVGKYNVITPSACAVEQIEDKGFNVVEILASPEEGSWIEYETTDFINEHSEINPTKGEKEASNSVMLYLNRKVGERDQRIFVSGDADCLATSELTTSRAGLEGKNFMMITEIFRNLSYNEYPVETPRVRAPDDKIYIKETGLLISKIVFIFILPFSLLGLCIWLWIRRRGR